MLKLTDRSGQCCCCRPSLGERRAPLHTKRSRPIIFHSSPAWLLYKRSSVVIKASNSGLAEPQPDDQREPAAQQHQDSSTQPIPWGLARIFQVIALWLTAFYTVGTLVVPMLLEVVGINQAALSATGQAILYLVIDFGQLLSALMILRWCAHQHPNYKLQDLLPLHTRNLGAWLPLLLLSCLTFPCIDYIAFKLSTVIPMEVDMWPGAVEGGLLEGEWGAHLANMATTLLCAPIWEEAIFRGFLLASLTNLMAPLPSTIFSSVLFALFHFKLTGFLPLFLLGCVFSVNYLRARTLLAPILLHSLWNLYLWVVMVFRPGWW